MVATDVTAWTDNPLLCLTLSHTGWGLLLLSCPSSSHHPSVSVCSMSDRQNHCRGDEEGERVKRRRKWVINKTWLFSVMFFCIAVQHITFLLVALFVWLWWLIHSNRKCSFNTFKRSHCCCGSWWKLHPFGRIPSIERPTRHQKPVAQGFLIKISMMVLFAQSQRILFFVEKALLGALPGWRTSLFFLILEHLVSIVKDC